MSDSVNPMHPDHPAAQRAEAFAGLPVHTLMRAAAGGGLPSKPRYFTEYPIPEQLVSPEFYEAGFGPGDLMFRMVELKPSEQEAAVKVGGQNAAVVSREMIFKSIWQIGDWKTAGNREKLELWWDSVGARVMSLVQAAFVSTQSVEEDEVARFLESGKKGRG